MISEEVSVADEIVVTSEGTSLTPTPFTANDRLIPFSTEGESTNAKRWFKINYFARIPFHTVLQLACSVRGSGHTCLFGETWVGGFNVAVTLRFDNGVEWIFKAPKDITNETKNRLNSEVATLKFLAEIGGLPVPLMHDYSTSPQNPAQTPYIIMDKVAGVTLSLALTDSRFGKTGRARNGRMARMAEWHVQRVNRVLHTAAGFLHQYFMSYNL
jgi:hypothetical protein